MLSFGASLRLVYIPRQSRSKKIFPFTNTSFYALIGIAACCDLNISMFTKIYGVNICLGVLLFLRGLAESTMDLRVQVHLRLYMRKK